MTPPSIRALISVCVCGGERGRRRPAEREPSGPPSRSPRAMSLVFGGGGAPGDAERRCRLGVRVQESPGMNRVGRCWVEVRAGRPAWQHRDLSPRARRKREVEIPPSSCQNKKVLQSLSLSLLVCQLTAVTKEFVAPGMCCFSGIEGAARNDNWVLVHFFF